MTDTAQLNLREPEQVDWDNLGATSTYAPPPPALDASMKPITYQGIAKEIKVEADKEGYLQFMIDPVVLKGNGADGTQVRFTRASAAPFTKKGENGERIPIKGNPNKAAQFLRSAGLTVKPQTNAEYIASAERVKNRPFHFTIDWEAYNKDTGESVRGYLAFPEDPERPGQRKSILRRGDIYNVLDSKGKPTGEVKTVESEILFANARVKFFQDPTRQRG